MVDAQSIVKHGHLLVCVRRGLWRNRTNRQPVWYPGVRLVFIEWHFAVGLLRARHQPGAWLATRQLWLSKKVYFAWETLVFAQVIFSFVQFCIEMTLLCVALLIVGSPIAPWIPVAFLLMLLLAVYAAGFALALSTLAVYFRDLRYLWTIIIQVMFFATPIIYTPDKIAGKVPPILEFILHWNPMAVFILSFRHLLYSGRAPEWGHIAYLLVASVVVFVGGWTIFVKQSRRLAEEL